MLEALGALDAMLFSLLSLPVTLRSYEGPILQAGLGVPGKVTHLVNGGDGFNPQPDSEAKLCLLPPCSQ